MSEANATNLENDVKIKDKAVHCPNCGQLLLEPGSLINEYWESEDTVYYCWCSNCRWKGEVKEVSRMVATEPAEDE